MGIIQAIQKKLIPRCDHCGVADYNRYPLLVCKECRKALDKRNW